MSGRSIPAISGRGRDFQELGYCPLFDPYGHLRTVMAPVGVSFSLVMCYSEPILRLKVQWKSTCPPSWTHLVLIRLCHVLGLCHSFKSCALPPSLLFQYESTADQSSTKRHLECFKLQCGENCFQKVFELLYKYRKIFKSKIAGFIDLNFNQCCQVSHQKSYATELIPKVCDTVGLIISFPSLSIISLFNLIGKNWYHVVVLFYMTL